MTKTNLHETMITKKILRQLINEGYFQIEEKDAWNIARLFPISDTLMCWKSKSLVIIPWGVVFTWAKKLKCGYENAAYY
jgi:hypothetical protein